MGTNKQRGKIFMKGITANSAATKKPTLQEKRLTGEKESLESTQSFFWQLESTQSNNVPT